MHSSAAGAQDSWRQCLVWRDHTQDPWKALGKILGHCSELKFINSYTPPAKLKQQGFP